MSGFFSRRPKAAGRSPKPVRRAHKGAVSADRARAEALHETARITKPGNRELYNYDAIRLYKRAERRGEAFPENVRRYAVDFIIDYRKKYPVGGSGAVLPTEILMDAAEGVYKVEHSPNVSKKDREFVRQFVMDDCFKRGADAPSESVPKVIREAFDALKKSKSGHGARL